VIDGDLAFNREVQIQDLLFSSLNEQRSAGRRFNVPWWSARWVAMELG
jgi:hypothetical protein